METAHRCYVGLGANLPHRGLAGAALLEAALETLAGEGGVTITAVSSAWRSPPWPPGPETHGQPPYLNAVVELWTAENDPRALLALLLAVERAFGRERRARWAARTLDLDIIDFAGRVVSEPGLTLPHPRAHERAFVLAPLAEIAPGWRLPPNGPTARSLLSRLPDQGVERAAGLRFRDCEGEAGRIS
ncbi:MAG: 2-amino-4-hydroxy-6-hydroxymethyldihydropteridine diphosphokinase [Alphaproteobacteria bacterium]|nr:2-amino-4-hydroxy-6-hydroxymethyldihydropteridine diphosphokinase [Alphaproteobacteria bacterium]